MVTVKGSTSNINFDTDPIEWKLTEDNWLTANDTTLGADNGIGVSIILAVLDSKDIVHGPLNAIFTTAEEQGMVGASNINLDGFETDYLLNLDAEGDTYIVVGCIGAQDLEMRIPKTMTDSTGEYVKIEFKDFHGGHSGFAVWLFVMNVIKSLARMIDSLEDFQIAEINGGVGMKNAVPSAAHAIVSVKNKQEAKKILEEVRVDLLNEYSLMDGEGTITISDADYDGQVMDYQSSKNLVELIQAFPDGVYKAYNNMLVTSSNLGILEDKGDYIHTIAMLRSDYKTELEYRTKVMQNIAEKYEAEWVITNVIPGWERETDQIVDLAKDLAEKTYGHDVTVLTAHGTLEPSFLKQHLPDVPMISIGPNMTLVHSPKEKVDINSVIKFYDYLQKLLAEIA